MTSARFIRLYAIAVLVMLPVDVLWLGVVARGFYADQMGHLTRPDTQWLPALAFYLVYAAAVVTLAVLPALERRSATRGVALGAMLGLAAYSAFDLTGLALLNAFPVVGALVDLAWGTFVTALVSGVTTLVGLRWAGAEPTRA